jgi:hypothetical protein
MNSAWYWATGMPIAQLVMNSPSRIPGPQSNNILLAQRTQSSRRQHLNQTVPAYNILAMARQPHRPIV